MVNKSLIAFFIIVLSIFCIKTTTLEKNKIAQQPKNTVNIYFNIDNNYVNYFLVTAFSIFKNNKSKSNIHIFLIEDDITKENKQKIIDFVEKKHKQKIDIIHFSDYTKVLNPKKFNYISHISKISFARVFVGSLLPQNINKVLYLDADLLVRKDISELYNTNIDNFIVAMVPYWEEQSIYGNCNGGVVLINLKEWRKQKIENKVLNHIKKEFEIRELEKNLAPQPIDQDAYNWVLKNKIYFLGQKWNASSLTAVYHCENAFFISRKTIWDDKAYLNHYWGYIKPWTVFPFSRQYILYYIYWFQSGEIKSMLKTFSEGFYRTTHFKEVMKNETGLPPQVFSSF